MRPEGWTLDGGGKAGLLSPRGQLPGADGAVAGQQSSCCGPASCSARAKVYFASLLTVALHGKLEYYTDIMRTLFLELMEQYVVAKNPKLMLRRCVEQGGGPPLGPGVGLQQGARACPGTWSASRRSQG